MDNKLLKVIEDTLRNLSEVKLSHKAKAQAILDAITDASQEQICVFERDKNEHQ